MTSTRSERFPGVHPVPQGGVVPEIEAGQNSAPAVDGEGLDRSRLCGLAGAGAQGILDDLARTPVMSLPVQSVIIS